MTAKRAISRVGFVEAEYFGADMARLSIRTTIGAAAAFAEGAKLTFEEFKTKNTKKTDSLIKQSLLRQSTIMTQQLSVKSIAPIPNYNVFEYDEVLKASLASCKNLRIEFSDSGKPSSFETAT